MTEQDEHKMHWKINSPSKVVSLLISWKQIPLAQCTVQRGFIPTRTCNVQYMTYVDRE